MEIILFIIGAIVCYLISSMIHEMGHVVCGLLHHWKLYMLVVGPMKLYRENMDSKIKMGIEKNTILWGGVGGTLPVKESEENVKVWGKILLAGPLTSIVFGILMLPVFIVTKNIFALLLCLMPIAMGAMCIIPMKMKRRGYLSNRFSGALIGFKRPGFSILWILLCICKCNPPGTHSGCKRAACPYGEHP